MALLKGDTKSFVNPQIVERVKIPIEISKREMILQKKLRKENLIRAYADATKDKKFSKLKFTAATKFRNLDFNGEFVSPGEAKQMIKVIDTYNNFTSKIGTEMINTPGVTEVRIAREGSPAMYFKTTNPKTLRNKLKQDGEADEVDIESRNGNIFTVRAWWD